MLMMVIGVFGVIKKLSIWVWFGVEDVCVRFLCLVNVLIRLDLLIFDCLVKVIFVFEVFGRFVMLVMLVRKF